MIGFAEYNNSFSDNSSSQTGSFFINCQMISLFMMPFAITVGGILLGPYMAVGLPANLWVMWLITHGTTASLAAEFLHLNMALCDTLFMMGIPLHLYCINGQGPFGSFIDIILLEELWVFVWVGRPLFQCCICVERYLAVVHPLTFLRFKPLRFRVACSCLMWFIITVNLSSIWAMSNEHIIFPSFYFTTALSVIVFCCLSVLWNLKQPGPGETERAAGNNMKRTAFNIILVNLVILFVNYAPLLVVWCLGNIFANHFHALFMSAEHLAVFCGIFQPLIYLHKSGKLTCVGRGWF